MKKSLQASHFITQFLCWLSKPSRKPKRSSMKHRRSSKTPKMKSRTSRKSSLSIMVILYQFSCWIFSSQVRTTSSFTCRASAILWVPPNTPMNCAHSTRQHRNQNQADLLPIWASGTTQNSLQNGRRITAKCFTVVGLDVGVDLIGNTNSKRKNESHFSSL